MGDAQPDQAAGDVRVPYTAVRDRLHPSLYQALGNIGYTHMTPVQEKVLMLPRYTDDCVVQAKTGTGKTVAFLLPMLQNHLTSTSAGAAGQARLPKGQVGILILSPTRELAQQIAAECDKLTALCRPAIECHLAFGGSNKASALRRFRAGDPTVLVATPGRLLDYLSEDSVRRRFDNLRAVVLDEADRLLDQGFFRDVEKLLALLPPKGGGGKGGGGGTAAAAAAGGGWQGMCFSATMPQNIVNGPLKSILRPDCVRLSTISADEAPTVDSIPQTLRKVEGIEQVLAALHHLLTAVWVGDEWRKKVVVFCSTARQAGLLYQVFQQSGVRPPPVPVLQMHSRMSQTVRTRTVGDFKNSAGGGVMFASDVVGRGIDFPDVELVVQVGVPMDKDQYVHRVGRTGRAGKEGQAVIILTPEEMDFVTKNKQFPIKDDGYDARHASVLNSQEIIDAALAGVPKQAKEQAYAAFLGYMRTKLSKLPRVELVRLANRYAASLGCADTPELEPSTVGKMGLKGVPGLNVRGQKRIPIPGDVGGGGVVGGGGGWGGRGGANSNRNNAIGAANGNSNRKRKPSTSVSSTPVPPGTPKQEATTATATAIDEDGPPAATRGLRNRRRGGRGGGQEPAAGAGAGSGSGPQAQGRFKKPRAGGVA